MNADTVVLVGAFLPVVIFVAGFQFMCSMIRTAVGG